MEQVVFLIILGAIAFIRWLYERSKEAQAGQEMEHEEDPRERRIQMPRPDRREITEAERMRRFMEALGIPQGEAPPSVPSVQRPEMIPARPPQPPTPPPVPVPAQRSEGFEVEQLHRPESSMERKIAEAHAATQRAEAEASAILAQLSPAQARMAAAVPVLGPRGKDRKPGKFGPNIRHRLRDRQLTAESIVLAEILGPPRAMAPHKMVGRG